MIDYVATDVELTGVADAIRAKGGTSGGLVFPDGFVTAINNIVIVNNQSKSGIVPTTSSQTITADSGYTGLDSVQVNGDANLVPSKIKYGITIFGVSGTFTATPSGKTALTAAALRSGYAGFINGNQVNGSMPDTVVTEGITTVSGTTATRGTWSQTAGYTALRTLDVASFGNEATSGHSYVDISDTTASPVLVSGGYLFINKGWTDDLKISLSKLVPDGSDVKGHSEYLLLGHSAYDNDGVLVAGSIPTKTSTDLTASGKTVTIPSGYYGQQYTKDIVDGSATTPATTITANPAISVDASGLITATASQTQSVTPTVQAGYVASGTAGTITVYGSSTSQLTVQAAQTITPTTIDQTIPSGKYLTGTQTIKGDANLSPENIKYGVTLFGILGTHVGPGVIRTDTVDEHGGTIVNIEAVNEFNCRGVNVEFLRTLNGYEISLADTSFPTWTPSSTATSMKAAVNESGFTANMLDYEYIIVWKCNVNIKYKGEVANAKGKFLQHSFVSYQYIVRRANDLAAVRSGNMNGVVADSSSPTMSMYMSSGTATTFVYNASYGFYFTATAPAVSSVTANTPTITPKTPILYARTSSTYFTSAFADDIDQENSTIKVTGNVYKCRIGTLSRMKYYELIRVFNEEGDS